MKHTLTLVLLATGLVLAGCYKDEVAHADLTTNPFDPDYEGPALIDLIGDSTYRLTDNFGQVIDTVIQFDCRVNSHLFPVATAYALDGVPVNGTQPYQGGPQAPGDNLAFVLHKHVQDGQAYCIDVSIEVLGSNTRSYRFCATADL